MQPIGRAELNHTATESTGLSLHLQVIITAGHLGVCVAVFGLSGGIPHVGLQMGFNIGQMK